MKRVTMTVWFNIEVPDETMNDDLCLEIDLPTVRIMNTSGNNISGKIINYETVSVDE